MPKKLLKNSFFLTLTILGLFITGLISSVAAQPTPSPTTTTTSTCEGIELGGGGALGSMCIKTLTPFGGIAEGGIISALSQLFNYLFLILFLLWLVTIALTVYDYIRAEGNAEMTKQSWLNTQYIWKGLSLGLIGFVGIYAIGLLAGLGNPLEWPNNFYQCGSEHIIYMNYKSDLQEWSSTPVTLGGVAPDEYYIYCCNEGSSGSDGWTKESTTSGISPDVMEQTRPQCKFFKKETIK